MRRDRLTAGSQYGSQRSLWCELPEVRQAGLLETLDEGQRKLQEAYFEVIKTYDLLIIKLLSTQNFPFMGEVAVYIYAFLVSGIYKKCKSLLL